MKQERYRERETAGEGERVALLSRFSRIVTIRAVRTVLERFKHSHHALDAIR